MAEISDILDHQQRPIRSIFVSSYIPRKCGIATFTKDLTSSLNDLNPESTAEIIAVDHDDSDLYYPWEVKYKVHRDNLDSYFQAAEYVNQSSADVVCLQHEFGLFGGDAGEYIFSFLRNINKPVITTFHTVLAKPLPANKIAVQRIAGISRQIVVTIPEAKERLEKQYNVDKNKIVIINHGVPDQAKANKINKKKFRWQNKKILLMTGLINLNKGIEYVIKAMPEILKEIPDANLVIVGQTHPDINKSEGEKYRKSLILLAHSLKVEKNLKFINQYISLSRLLSYYEACDIYLTPHQDKEQISSGTLAYALGMGKACISTPYPYAKHMLSNQRGILVDFANSKQIAKSAVTILRNPELEEKLCLNAYMIGRRMRWPRVAERYLNLFRFNTRTPIISNEKNRITTSTVSNR